MLVFFFFSSRRRHTRCGRDWSSDVCSSDLRGTAASTPAPSGWSRTQTHVNGSAGTTAAKDCGRSDTSSTSPRRKIGRASCRERVEVWGGSGAVEQEKKIEDVVVDVQRRPDN